MSVDQVFQEAVQAQTQRQFSKAQTLYEQILRQDPHHFGAISMMGLVLFEQRRFDLALGYFEKSLQLNPGLAETHNHLGETYLALNEFDKAAQLFEQALELKPDFLDAYSNRGRVHQQLDERDEALRRLNTGFLVSHGLPRVGADDIDFDRTAYDRLKSRFNPDRRVSYFKLKHDLEQLTYLKKEGLIASEYDEAIRAYETVLNQLTPQKPPQVYSLLSDDQLSLVQEFYLKNLYLAQAPAFSGPALNPDLDFEDIQAKFLSHPYQISCFDALLTQEALQSLRQYCLQSTFWHGFQYGTYLGSYLTRGFCCGLLLQIAAELREKLPRIFRDYPLKQMWGYKYDTEQDGIPIHADFAAVNVNFWIAPDESNLDPDSGGLVVYKAEAPLDWGFDIYNRDSGTIHKFLQETKAESERHPHRQNRMVLFNSNLFHNTDTVRFKPGYENRRINVTMLFGIRETR